MQAGRRGRFRRAATRLIGASDCRFPSLFDGGRELSRAAKHVDARDGVLSDAGSTPAASTTFSSLISLMFLTSGFSVYLLRTNFAVLSGRAAHDLPTPSDHVPACRQTEPRCLGPEMRLPHLGPRIARRRVSAAQPRSGVLGGSAGSGPRLGSVR